MGDGSMQVTWTRRTRVDGDGWMLSDVPLGEAYEAYRVRILASGILRREVTVPIPFWTYSVAEQTEDVLAGGFTIEVAQISDRVGPGHFARIEING